MSICSIDPGHDSLATLTPETITTAHSAIQSPDSDARPKLPDSHPLSNSRSQSPRVPCTSLRVSRPFWAREGTTLGEAGSAPLARCSLSSFQTHAPQMNSPRQRLAPALTSSILLPHLNCTQVCLFPGDRQLKPQYPVHLYGVSLTLS